VSGQRDASAYLADMIGAMESIISQTAGVDDATVMDPAQPLRGHVLHQLTMLGEAAKHLPADVSAQIPGVPIDAMCRLRDRIVHYYFGVDDAVILSTIRVSLPRDLPPLRGLLERLGRG
jgi:uncharacterized protein with HEPN domain